jgi:hypothetical protein
MNDFGKDIIYVIGPDGTQNQKRRVGGAQQQFTELDWE